MNSLNLKQIDGGNIIKQADSGSMFKFELLDENHKKFEEQLDDTATVILKQGTVAVFKKIVAITDNCVAFNLDKILEVGDYILEIIVGEYVFPSNNRLKISVESTYGDYQPENLVRITYEEIDEKINALTDRLEELNVAGQTEMMNRIVALEKKEDRDTIYDDTDVKVRLTALESKEDKDTVYDDTSIKQSISSVDTKVDNLSEKVTELVKRPIYEAYDDTELSSRVTALEQKEDHDTIYDDTELKERLSNLENKEGQYVSKFSGLELKDSDLESRVSTLEQKEDKDTVYDDSTIVERIEALENKPDNDTIYDDSEIKQKIAEIEANAPAVHLAYADSEDGSVGFTKFKPPIVLNTTFLNTTKRFVGMSVKDSNDYRDYVWIPNPELSKNWQYYELAATILDDCKKELSTLYSFNSASTRINNVVGAVIVKEDPYITLMQKGTDTNNILQFDTVNVGDALFSFIAEQDGQFDNDWYLFDANNNKTYIHSGLNIIFAKPRWIGKDGDIVNPLKIRNTLCYGIGELTFNFTLTQDEIIKITTLAHNTYTKKYTLYQKIMNGIVLYAYPQGSVVLMQNDTSPAGLLKRGVWSKLGEIALTNPDGKLYAYVRVI